MTASVVHGDCVEAMASMEPGSVDCVVTDPPYMLGFMGRSWDTVGGRVMDDETRQRQLASGAGWTEKPYAASGSNVYECGCPLQFDAEQGERRVTYRNIHATVKPIELMRWLIRMVCPPGGRVLDPFLGSGSTGCAAMLESCVGSFVGIEQDAEYVRIAEARIAFWAEHGEDALRMIREQEARERRWQERREELVEAGQASLFDNEVGSASS